MTMASEDGMLLWEPALEVQQRAVLSRYMHWLGETRGLAFEDQAALWQWSVDHLEDFWSSIWDFFQVQSAQPVTTVLSDHTMPGARWFPGTQLNYVAHVLRHATTTRPALLFQSERHPLRAISWDELTQQVAAVAHALRQLGIQPGDRIASCMPNIPETLVAFLACASLGAIWSSCSPDFGSSSVVERFQQIEPVLLFAVDGYQYHGKAIDTRATVAALQLALPTVRTTVLLPYLYADTQPALSDTIPWSDLLHTTAPLQMELVPFEHPLWILYSSGTTGLPKPIVQGHGGILLEHLKQLTLSLDLKPQDRFFWFTTTGWMMWNLLIGGLLVGCTVLLYDGSPTYPDPAALWHLAEQSRMTFFGTSASYITASMKANLEPIQHHDLSTLRAMGSTGSPLAAEGFRWVYQHVKRDLWLTSISGGTDVCSAFLGGSPLLPVYAGELQCRALGAKVEAFDELGQSVIEEVGELVITAPMPSMPLYFWHDPHKQRYRESYFELFPGVWRHGDWVKITARGSAIIYGRSDATINRMGIRMGSSEIYRVVEALPEVLDSLIVGVELPGGRYYMPLFVVLREGSQLDDALIITIKTQLRRHISPHHVPDTILVVPAIPRTLSGKKLEVPIKKLLMGVPVHKAVSLDALSNPDSIAYFQEHAKS